VLDEAVSFNLNVLLKLVLNFLRLFGMGWVGVVWFVLEVFCFLL
jgi:hypothetical protein